jgi:hypothetical protein
MTPQSRLSVLALICSYVFVSTGQLNAQLNQNCTVSILNRTTQAQLDGSWVINNIPAGFGLVRARATCVQNGTTQFGQSGLFSISANQATGFDAQIVLGPTTPIPATMTLSAQPATLTSVGQTSQLALTATYPDGTSANVTTASAGTKYQISNSAIATVSSNGLVTAVSSGTVVIEALNEGTQGGWPTLSFSLSHFRLGCPTLGGRPTLAKIYLSFFPTEAAAPCAVFAGCAPRT